MACSGAVLRHETSAVATVQDSGSGCSSVCCGVPGACPCNQLQMALLLGQGSPGAAGDSLREARGSKCGASGDEAQRHPTTTPDPTLTPRYRLRQPIDIVDGRFWRTGLLVTTPPPVSHPTPPGLPHASPLHCAAPRSPSRAPAPPPLCVLVLLRTRSSAPGTSRTQVSDLAERYAPSPSWFVSTISEVFRLGGEHVDEAASHGLVRLIAEQDEGLHAQVGRRRAAKSSSALGDIVWARPRGPGRGWWMGEGAGAHGSWGGERGPRAGPGAACEMGKRSAGSGGVRVKREKPCSGGGAVFPNLATYLYSGPPRWAFKCLAQTYRCFVPRC